MKTHLKVKRKENAGAVQFLHHHQLAFLAIVKKVGIENAAEIESVIGAGIAVGTETGKRNEKEAEIEAEIDNATETQGGIEVVKETVAANAEGSAVARALVIVEKMMEETAEIAESEAMKGTEEIVM